MGVEPCKTYTNNPLTAVQSQFAATFNVRARQADKSMIRSMIAEVSGTSSPLTTEEVVRAVRESRNQKAPGADQVPVELLLKHIVAQEGGPEKLTTFYQYILDANLPPQQWNSVAVTLLGKTDTPLHPGDLRPIAVHSQVAKVMSRILLQRVRDKLAPRQPGQAAAKGRQPGDYVWSMQRLCQLAYEWGVPIAMVKIDISKAFDMISRVTLGKMILHRLGRLHPQECRMFLTYLLPYDITIATPWADVTTHSNSGVKQGAVESPVMFAAAMEDILLAALSTFTGDTRRPGCHVHG